MTPVEKVLRDNLIAIIDAYRKATGRSMTAISRAFYGKAKHLDLFKAGTADIALEKYGAMIQAFQDKWPPGAPFPFLRSLIVEMPKEKRGQQSRPPVRQEPNRLSAPDHENAAEPDRRKRGHRGRPDAAAAGSGNDHVAGAASSHHRGSSGKNNCVDAAVHSDRRRGKPRRKPARGRREAPLKRRES